MRQKKYIILLILAVCLFGCSQQQKEAFWITHPEVSEGKNLWHAYKTEFEVKGTPESDFVARIAVDSKYWLYLNDTLVVFEGGLKRGPNPSDTYIDEVNLKPYLKKGTNTIGILVWHFGKEGFCHKTSGKSGLFFELNNKHLQLVSDSTWLVMQHPAFGNTGKPHPNYRLPESNIHFDARKDISAWFRPGVGAESFLQAEVVGKEGIAPWNSLITRPIPQWFDTGLIEYEYTKDTLINNNRVVYAYLPKNITITPHFEINAPEGLLIDVRTDNYKGGSEHNVRTEYITKEGNQEFETFGYQNGHYVIYTFPKEVEIIDLKYRETKYNAELIGKFESNDPYYDKLWEKAVNTLNVNMRDAIQDPDRERAQWWGDVVILMGEIFYTLDENGILALDKSIRNLVDWQKEDGTLYSPVPAGSWHNELPTQMLASVGKYGFWLYYEYTADTALMEYVYPSVKKYLSLWEQEENGLVKHRKGGWTWLDWGQKIDSALVYNTWYYMALESAMNMAQLNGDSEYFQECKLKSEKLYAGFNQTFWDGNSYRSEQYKYGYDDRGNGLAVVAGLAGDDKYEAIAQTLKTTYHASPYIEKYILEALFLMDRPSQALQRMKERFANMVNSELTTLWEGWGIGSAGFGGGTYNHGWSGGGLTLLTQYAAGISPLEPGFKSIKIAPQMGSLKQISSTVPLPGGVLEVDLENDKEQFSIRIQNKLQLPIKLYLPLEKGKVFSKILVNSVELTGTSGQDQPEGVEFLGYEEDKAVIMLNGWESGKIIGTYFSKEL